MKTEYTVSFVKNTYMKYNIRAVFDRQNTGIWLKNQNFKATSEVYIEFH
jgi:hypothetical protein